MKCLYMIVYGHTSDKTKVYRILKGINVFRNLILDVTRIERSLLGRSEGPRSTSLAQPQRSRHGLYDSCTDSCLTSLNLDPSNSMLSITIFVWQNKGHVFFAYVGLRAICWAHPILCCCLEHLGWSDGNTFSGVNAWLWSTGTALLVLRHLRFGHHILGLPRLLVTSIENLQNMQILQNLSSHTKHCPVMSGIFTHFEWTWLDLPR